MLQEKKEVKKVTFFIISVVLLCLSMVFNLKDELNATESSQQAALQQSVSFRLKWRYGATSCGALIAKNQAFFSNQGLDIKINQGGFELDSKKMVVAGTDQIGLTGADELILARANGMPIVAIGADFQKTPGCIFTLKNSGILKPQDFSGKRMGVRKATNVEYQYDVLLKRLKIDRKLIKEEPIKFELTRAAEGHLDMWTSYISEKPREEAWGSGLKDLNTIWFADYGIQSFGNVLFTSESFLKKNPEIVKRFLRAYYQGWKWAIENPKQVGDIIKNFNPQASKEMENAIFSLTAPLLKPDKGKPLGYMDEKLWEETQKIMLESGQLKKRIDIKKAFTNGYISHD